MEVLGRWEYISPLLDWRFRICGFNILSGEVPSGCDFSRVPVCVRLLRGVGRPMNLVPHSPHCRRQRPRYTQLSKLNTSVVEPQRTTPQSSKSTRPSPNPHAVPLKTRHRL